MPIIDSSTLISLAKINKLDVLSRLRKDIKVPKNVFDESVVIAKEKGYSDAYLIEKEIKKDEYSIAEIEEGLVSTLEDETHLGKADCSVLALALKYGEEVIVNDNKLSIVAESLDIKTITSPDLLLNALLLKIIDFEEFKDSLYSLEKNQRVSHELMEYYLRIGEKEVR